MCDEIEILSAHQLQKGDEPVQTPNASCGVNVLFTEAQQTNCSYLQDKKADQLPSKQPKKTRFRFCLINKLPSLLPPKHQCYFPGACDLHACRSGRHEAERREDSCRRANENLGVQGARCLLQSNTATGHPKLQIFW